MTLDFLALLFPVLVAFVSGLAVADAITAKTGAARRRRQAAVQRHLNEQRQELLRHVAKKSRKEEK